MLDLFQSPLFLNGLEAFEGNAKSCFSFTYHEEDPLFEAEVWHGVAPSLSRILQPLLPHGDKDFSFSQGRRGFFRGSPPSNSPFFFPPLKLSFHPSPARPGGESRPFPLFYEAEIHQVTFPFLPGRTFDGPFVILSPLFPFLWFLPSSCESRYLEPFSDRVRKNSSFFFFFLFFFFFFACLSLPSNIRVL